MAPWRLPDELDRAALALVAACALGMTACGGEKSVLDRAREVCVRDSSSPQTELRELRLIDDERVKPLASALGDALDDVYWLHVANASGDRQLAISATTLGRRAAARVHAAAAVLGAPECG